MTNIIDILIKAQWLGGAALGGASAGLRDMGNNAARSTVEMAVMKEKTSALNFKLSELAREVGVGNLTIEEATEKYQAAAETLGLVGEAAPEAGAGLKSLIPVVGAATAALAVGTIAAKKFYSALREGAELDYVQGRFDKLAVSMGTTSAALRTDLRYATQGMVTDAELMAMATDLMAQGLANTHEEAVRLVGVGAELDISMSQLLNTLAEQTTTQFDAMGISVDGFEVKLKELEKAGYDTDEAFKFAFMEQAEAQIELIGSRAETTAGQLDILTVAWENTKDEVKLALLQGFAPFIEDFSEGIMAVVAMEKAVQDAEGAFGDLVKQKEAVKEFSEALATLRGDEDIPFMGPQEHQALADFAAALITTGKTAEEQQEILRSFGFTFEETLLGTMIVMEGYSTGWDSVTEALSNARLEAQASYDAFERLASQEGYIIPEMPEDITEEMEKLKEQLDAIHFDELLEKAGMTSDEFIHLAYEMGGAEQAIASLKKELSKGETATKSYGMSISDLIGDILTLSQTAYEMAIPMLEERADLFLDFQSDLTDISTREGEQREAAEERYEERRTDIMERYGLRRSQGEEDFQRGRARSEAKHLADIEDIRESSGDRQLELRQEANRSLVDLESDHLDRMQEIIENAELQLAEAASRLDARAVASITAQREDALGDERDSYQKSRKGIQQQLDEQLKDERKNAEERIEEMQEFHEERKRQEDEDRQIRLQRLEEAHQEQLKELDDKHRDELLKIREQARRAQSEREIRWFEERSQLDDHWEQRSILESSWMNTILEQEAEFWNNRLSLVGGGDAVLVQPPAGGGGGGGGGDSDRPTRTWLEYMAMDVSGADTNTWPAWSQLFHDMSDAELAAWIEANSDIDVPGYAAGGRIAEDMLALVGERGPELVALPSGAQVFDSGLTSQFFRRAGGMTVGDVTVIVNESERPGDTAREVREEMLKVFEELAE